LPFSLMFPVSPFPCFVVVKKAEPAISGSANIFLCFILIYEPSIFSYRWSKLPG
jgi:hypothetical protein